MDIKTIITEIENQKMKIRKARATGVNLNNERERMKNILLTHTDEILEALAMADESEEKIKILNLQLDDSERDLSEVEKELKELKAKVAVTPEKQRKAKVVTDGEQG